MKTVSLLLSLSLIFPASAIISTDENSFFDEEEQVEKQDLITPFKKYIQCSKDKSPQKCTKNLVAKSNAKALLKFLATSGKISNVKTCGSEVCFLLAGKKYKATFTTKNGQTKIQSVIAE